jgi:hypothetical protein
VNDAEGQPRLHLSDMSAIWSGPGGHRPDAFKDRRGRGENDGSRQRAGRRLTITGIACQTGPGTMYVRASTPHHKCAFFQLIQENRDNVASDDIGSG